MDSQKRKRSRHDFDADDAIDGDFDAGDDHAFTVAHRDMISEALNTAVDRVTTVVRNQMEGRRSERHVRQLYEFEFRLRCVYFLMKERPADGWLRDALAHARELFRLAAGPLTLAKYVRGNEPTWAGVIPRYRCEIKNSIRFALVGMRAFVDGTDAAAEIDAWIASVSAWKIDGTETWPRHELEPGAAQAETE